MPSPLEIGREGIRVTNLIIGVVIYWITTYPYCLFLVVDGNVFISLALCIGAGRGDRAALAVGCDNDSPTDCYLAGFLAGHQ